LRILAAAARPFGEHGYDAVSGDEITRAAGVAKGAIYHDFGCKRGLLSWVAGSYGEGLAQAMFAGVSADVDHLEVGPMVRRAFAYVAHSDPLFAIYLLADCAESSLEASRASREAIIENLILVFSAWAKRGLVRTANQRILAELCFGLVESALRQCFAGQRSRRSRRVHRRSIVRAGRALAVMLQVN